MEGTRPRPGVQACRAGLTAADARALSEAARGGWAGTGVIGRLFEARLARAAGAPFALATGSGTAALHLALSVLDVGEGSEVITTALTSVATNHAILYRRARPVFCDVEPEWGTLDPAMARRLVTRRTRAIMAVHFNGQPCDMDALRGLARSAGLALVEDACMALPPAAGQDAAACGSWKGRPLGTLGDIGCFSFGGKAVTTMDGGALLFRRSSWERRLRRLRNLGQTEGAQAWERGRGASAVAELGFPYRMNDLAAALGLSQFSRWDKTLARLRRLSDLYRRELAGVEGLVLPADRPGGVRALSCFPVRVLAGRCRALRVRLLERGIMTDDWLRPAHLLRLYAPYRRPLPEAERLARELLYLPFHPGLSGRAASAVAAAVRACLERLKRSRFL